MKAVEFLRVSTQEQGNDDRAGLPRQKEANALTIHKHNLAIIKTIRIVDVSGTSVLHTPEVKDLISTMHSGQIQGVVVADWDRLIRLDNFNDFSLLQHFKETRTKIFLPDQVIDLNTQSGFLIGGFQSIISGNELTQIKKRMIQAKEVKRRNGEHPNNLLSLPTGVSYNYDSRRFFYTDEIEKIKRLFHLFVYDGIQNYSELERLTGIHHRTIPNLLRNEIYIGYRVYTQKRSHEKNIKANGRQGDRKKVKRSPDEIIKVKVIDEPAVTESVFREALKQVNKKNNEYHKKKSKAGQRFLYSGFLRCGVCGEMMYSTSGGKNRKKDYYYCRNKNSYYVKKKGGHVCSSSYLQKQTVENTIDCFVTEKLTEPDYLKELIMASLDCDESSRTEAMIKGLEKELKKITNKKSKILDLYGDGIFTKQELDNKVSLLNDEVSEIEIKLLNIKDRALNIEQFASGEIILPFVSALAEFSYWQPSEKRTFLRSQIPEITLTKEGITASLLNFCKSGTRMGKDSWRPPT